MVDMDNTLIHSVHKGDSSYYSCNGKKMSYIYDGENIEIKVSVRPYAIDMIKKINQAGHEYILWSAGKKDYVHTVMKYFIEISDIIPDKIYTREDMVPSEKADNGLGSYKSMVAAGFTDLSKVLIIDDNDSLIHHDELDRLLNVSTWTCEDKNDMGLQRIIEFIKTYDNHTKIYYSYEKPKWKLKGI